MGKAASKSKLTAASLLLTTTLVQAAPLGGQVTAGSAQITQTGLVTNVTQQSNNASLSWQSFNVGATETVNFLQPSASAIAVNRILDTNGSQIMGHLNANGQVYLINPNGILFGQGSQVNVGGLVASTLDVADSSLSSNTRTFTGAGTGSIVNKGSLIATPGGYISLLGNQVSNQGYIVAQLGTVALGGGSAATLTFNGNNLVKLHVDQSTLNNLVENKQLVQADGGQVVMTAGASDSLLASVVNNTGTVQAQTVWNHAGSITLLGGMAGGTVKVDGKIDASAPNGGDGGFIETSAKKVQVAATANISTAAPGGKTGNWLVDPFDFTVAATGGDITAAKLNTLLNTTSVTIDTNNPMVYNPPTAGNTTGVSNPTYTGSWPTSSGSYVGVGNIFINDATPLVWGKLALGNTTLTLNAGNDVIINAPMTVGAAANGALSSPFGLTINANRNIVFNNVVTVAGKAAVNLNYGLGGFGNDIFNLTSTGFTGRLDITSTNANALTINMQPFVVVGGLDASLNFILNTGSTISSTSTPPHLALGKNVTVTTLGTSGNNIDNLFGPSEAYSGTLDGLGHTLSQPAYTVNTVYGGTCNGGQVCGGLFTTLNLGGVIQNMGLIGGAVTTTFNGTFDPTGSISNQHSYAGALVGDNQGFILNSYSTVAVIGNGVGGVGGLVGRNGGTIYNSFSTGAVTGSTSTLLNHAGGLVATNHGIIDSSYATGIVTETSQSTYAAAGGLVAANFSDGQIYNSYATGAVKGTIAVSTTANPSTLSGLGIPLSGGMFGGLIALNVGIIDGSYSSGTVTGTTVTPALAAPAGTAYRAYLYEGGLVGVNGNGQSVCGFTAVDTCGIINNSHSSSILAVTATNNNTIMSLGGLAGVNAGDITGGSYATGNFSGSYALPAAAMSTVAGLAPFDGLNTLFQAGIGGLVGTNTTTGVISDATATSAITFTSPNANNIALVGGLAGYNSGLISGSTANGTITSTASTGSGVGGLVGFQYNAYNGADRMTIATVQSSTANEAITVTGAKEYLGGLVSYNYGGNIYDSKSTGTLTLTDNYAGTELTEIAYVGGAVGRNYSQPILGITTGLISGTTSSVAVTASVPAKTHGLAEGGLVGMNEGTIEQSSATGIVKATSAAAATDGTSLGKAFTAVGGLVGVNGGTINSGLSIGNFNATSLTLTGLTNGIGGLVGYNGGTINHAMSTNTITASGKGIGLGGLVGNNDGVITDAGAYSTLTLAVTATAANCTATPAACLNAVGGLVGSTGQFNTTGPISIGNSYAVTGLTSSGIQTAVGGLVGASSPLTTVADSYAIGKIATTNTSSVVGGLVGLNTGSIDTTYSSVAITGTGTATNALTSANTAGNYVGGIAGLSFGSIATSYWNKDLTTLGQSATSTNPGVNVRGLTSAQMLSRANFVGFQFLDGFAVDMNGVPVDGLGNPITITGNHWAQLNLDSSTSAPHTYSNLVTDPLTGTSTVTLDPLSGGIAATSGGTLPMLASEWSPTIWNAHQLQLMALAPTANYTLGQSIDASNTAKGTAVDVWTGAGFITVGQGIYDGTSFTGSLDGKGNAIRNLMINATVDMKLINAIDDTYNLGSVSGTTFAVGLIGRSFGTVGKLSMLGGSVTATNTEDMAGYAKVLGADGIPFNNQGGVSVGTVVATVKDTGVVKNVYSNTSVTANGMAVAGGLTGANNGVIKGSVAAGTVSVNTNFVKTGSPINTAGSFAAAGGLVGANSGQIAASYATGNVTLLVGSGTGYPYTVPAGITGQGFAGGLVGIQRDKGTTPSTTPGITGSYATGNVTATVTGAATATATGYTYSPGLYTDLSVGGLVGQNGFSTDTLKPTITGGYATGQVKATGSAIDPNNQDPYMATTPSGFVNMGGLVGTNYGNISGSNAGGNFTAAITGSLLSVGGLVGNNAGWDSLNPSTIDNSYASGTITVTGNNNNVGGLVGQDSGTISGNSYSSGAINVTGTEIFAGGLVGSAYNGVISNSSSSVALTVTDTNLLATTVINPVNNTATPVAQDDAFVGGLVGLNNDKILFSSATGSIAAKVGSNTRLFVGGLVGNNNGWPIPATYAPGMGAIDPLSGLPSNVIPAIYSGGVIQNSYATTLIKNTYSSGSTGASIGGLVGWNNGEIIASNASGNFSGSYALYTQVGIGGLVGNNSQFGTIISSSANTSFAVTGTALTTAKCSGTCIAAGGLVGNNDGLIEGSYANSTITAAGSNNSVGGLVGFMGFDAWYFGIAANGVVSKSYATTKLTSSGAGNNVGGLVGGTFIQPGGGITLQYSPTFVYNTSYIHKSYATGTITSTDTASFVGGLVGKNTLAIANGAIGMLADPLSIINPLSGSSVAYSNGIGKSYTMVTYTATGLGTKSGPLWGLNTGTVSTNDFWLPGI